MNHHLVLPILIPLITAIATLLVGKNRDIKRGISIFGAGLGLGYAIYLLWLVWQNGIQVAALSNWALPYGIALTADLLSAVMLVLSSLMANVVLLYTFATLDPQRERFGFYPLYQFLLMGVNGAFLAGDLFNLYVWFEVMLITSYGLMTLGGQRGQLEGGLKYVVINLVSSTIFLIAVGLLYGVAGTLNMAHLALVLAEAGPSPLVSALAMLFMVCFGIKAALFPLFFWLPASYHTPPVAVTALFGGLLTKVGVYALFRVFTLLFSQHPSFIHDLLLLLAGLTMTTGVLGAIAQNNVRRILSFHIISQIGYMIMGLGLFTTAGLAGGIFYIIHHMIVKTALLMVGGALEQLGGSGELKEMGGQLRQRPWLAFLFLVAAFSLAGIPPLSGFFSKVSLLKAAVSQGQYGIAAVSLIVSVLTLFSMTKIWTEVFWKPSHHAPTPEPRPGEWKLVAPAAILVTLTVLVGLSAELWLNLATTAAAQLMAPMEFAAQVLGH
jgi:multicomponent Na+:H+ antiporter subunit D